ncbi:FMN-linked oxidoreductase [Dacryopinax primogenitus]|uniref:tRNA-dihydrouridine(47) synthase [NAD(P)(+)] n=1 Tax=Dacryopinax primogenitus (strain DJM 731) TaxID=1858805 RepID=M5GC52_DACPD|nr:FMN-linked oxidoreductase [Dacryopinax primogenitus]EJU01613.1 FMN-linked oxidoreductase [Dacryopinax primogenitus]
MATSSILAPGTAPVKAEYLISIQVVDVVDDDAAEGVTNPATNDFAVTKRSSDEQPEEEPEHKKQKLSSSQRRRLAKEERKAKRGQNKNRRFTKAHDEIDLCWNAGRGIKCPKEELASCKFSHDLKSYLESKLPDVRIPRKGELLTHPPYVTIPAEPDNDTGRREGIICPEYRELGECKYAFKCRFLADHVEPIPENEEDHLGVGLRILYDANQAEIAREKFQELNRLASPGLLKDLRTKKYPTPKSDEYLAYLATLRDDAPTAGGRGAATANADVESAEQTMGDQSKIPRGQHEHHEEPQDTPDVPMRPVEKLRLHWKNQTYLAPLSTVGNLPFRRLCVDYGASITCAEMGLAASLLNASKAEWSLVRRHPSEGIFGTQLAGNKPGTLVAAAEVISRECPNVDFVDLNCGCPIDLVFKSGAGSALLDQQSKLSKILVGMNRTLGETPLTIKLRTGVKDGRNLAHRLMPRLHSWGVSAVTASWRIHGRSRQQRYSKLADWDYIKTCVDVLRASEADEGLSPIPIFGGGDVYSSQGYWECVEQSGVDGVMVARGALIKPWIFTEIKERREWDISSRERLDIVRQLCEYGLTHWGTDTAGVNTVRRYVCEALSFQHRYIPIGVLERPIGKLNERAPAYHGRDELETLLASTDSNKWVEISSMFLGPPPDQWKFEPKHRSNSTSEEGNG